MKELHEKFEASTAEASRIIKTKRILSGMDLFHLEREYVLISKEDYAKLLDEIKQQNNMQ